MIEDKTEESAQVLPSTRGAATADRHGCTMQLHSICGSGHTAAIYALPSEEELAADVERSAYNVDA